MKPNNVHFLLDGRLNKVIKETEPGYQECLNLKVGDMVDIDLSEHFGVVSHIQPYKIMKITRSEYEHGKFLTFHCKFLGKKSAI